MPSYGAPIFADLHVEQRQCAASRLCQSHPDGQMALNQKKEQPGIIAKRLRVACRHIAQAGRKKNPPKWYTEMFGSARVLDDGEGE